MLSGRTPKKFIIQLLFLRADSLYLVNYFDLQCIHKCWKVGEQHDIMTPQNNFVTAGVQINMWKMTQRIMRNRAIQEGLHKGGKGVRARTQFSKMSLKLHYSGIGRWWSGRAWAAASTVTFKQAKANASEFTTTQSHTHSFEVKCY